MRPRDELVEARRTNVGGRIEQAAQVSQLGPEVDSAAQPSNLGRAHYQLHFGAVLLEQGGRFKGTLAPAYHQDPLPAKIAKVSMITGMRRQLAWQVRKFRRLMRER